MRCVVCHAPVDEANALYKNSWEAARKRFACCSQTCREAFDPDIYWIPSRIPDEASEAETAKLLRVVKDRLRDGDAPTVVIRRPSSLEAALANIDQWEEHARARCELVDRRARRQPSPSPCRCSAKPTPTESDAQQLQGSWRRKSSPCRGNQNPMDERPEPSLRDCLAYAVLEDHESWLGAPSPSCLSTLLADGIERRSEESYGSKFAAFRVYEQAPAELLSWVGIAPA